MIRSLLLVVLAMTTTALPTAARETQELYTIELGLGETKLITEPEKWALKAEGQRFFDTTNFQELTDIETARKQNSWVPENVTYPNAVAHGSAVQALIPLLNKTVMYTNLVIFSDFHNRYYKSKHGKQSFEWLLQLVNSVIAESGAKNVTAAPFPHAWGQSSIIATIPGRTNQTIVIGAHQDSINLKNPMNGKAPGADDNGSGTMTILEAFRTLLADPKIATGQSLNTIEFHWYSAEEVGLLGSQAIFENYWKAGRDVKAMLQQDMTGYFKPGSNEVMGVVTDFVDEGLTKFTKLVIEAYCDIGYVDIQCGYACSDHSSATKAGYPSAFVFEHTLKDSNPSIHTPDDVVAHVDFGHVLEHAKMTLGLAYELAFAPFPTETRRSYFG